MTAPLAAIENATVANAFAALANAEAIIGGVVVSGVFDADFAETLGFVGGASPQLLCASADVASVVEGAAVTINAISYTVAEIHPDGTGVTVLKLESA